MSKFEKKCNKTHKKRLLYNRETILEKEKCMNRLIILEDNLEFSRNLLNYIISKNKKIQLWSIAIDGEEIEEKLDELQQTDILLLDLGLPKVNGLEVLDHIIEKKEHIPYIIVMSGNIDLQKKLRKYVPYLYAAIQKPFTFKRISEILDRITYISEEQYYEQLVKQELRKFEMNTTTIGYGYIVEAIVYSLKDESLLKDMKNALYKTISKKHNDVSIINIKWTIEKNIKSTMRYTSFSVLKSYFHIEAKEKVTPKFFITTVVENLQQRRNLPNTRKKEKLSS